VTRGALAEAELPPDECTYSSYEVMEMTGASYRQVDHWSRKGWIQGMPREVGCGYQRVWTPEMVEEVRWLLRASKAFLGPAGAFGHRAMPDLRKLAAFVKRAAEVGVFP
jgi:hypothetical protein